MKSDPDPLDEMLDLWEAKEATHGRLKQRVWARIANDAVKPESSALPGFFKLVHSVLSRPVYGAAFVVACVLLGLLLAEVRVANQHAQRGAMLAESYKQVIDPLINDPLLLR